MGDMKIQTLSEITALGVLGDMLKNTGVQAMGMAANYTTLNRELDISSDLLQRWQNVARASNVPVQAVAQSFATVQRTLAGFKQGVQNEGFLKGASFLGIGNANFMNYDQLFESLRAKVPELLKARGSAYVSGALGMMGIDPAMIQMFSLNSAQFKRREGSGPIISQDQIRDWTALNNQVTVLQQRLFMLGEEILSAALPSIVKWTQSLIDSEGWLKKRFGEAEDTASAPWVPGGGLSGSSVEHAIASLLIPKFVASQNKGTTVHNNPSNNFYITGDNPHAIWEQAKNYVERRNTMDLTTAIQQLNSRQAY